MKLTIQFLVALVILPYQLQSQYGTHQDEFINCIHEDEGDSKKGIRSTEIEFSVRPIQIFEMVGTTPEPQYISIELVSDENIDSIKFRESFGVEQFMFDDGLNGDVQANDNIYTTSVPIQISSSNSGTSRPFAIRKIRGRFAFYLNDGSIQKYSSSFS